MAPEARIIGGLAARLVHGQAAPTPMPRFIAARIPMAWVKAAYIANGGIVAWALWHHYGLNRRRPFRASLDDLGLGCVHRDTARRQLIALESAGLVLVQRRAGARPTLTLTGPGITTKETS